MSHMTPNLLRVPAAHTGMVESRSRLRNSFVHNDHLSTETFWSTGDKGSLDMIVPQLNFVKPLSLVRLHPSMQRR